jgi:hypothetical protein
MKFDYCSEFSESDGYQLVYHFQYSLKESEIEKTLWKYGDNSGRLAFNFSSIPLSHQIAYSLKLIGETFIDENVDLGVNYKSKYEELAKLLEPHKLGDNMSPATTLKMILKYGT